MAPDDQGIDHPRDIDDAQHVRGGDLGTRLAVDHLKNIAVLNVFHFHAAGNAGQIQPGHTALFESILFDGDHIAVLDAAVLDLLIGQQFRVHRGRGCGVKDHHQMALEIFIDILLGRRYQGHGGGLHRRGGGFLAGLEADHHGL